MLGSAVRRPKNELNLCFTTHSEPHSELLRPTAKYARTQVNFTLLACPISGTRMHKRPQHGAVISGMRAIVLIL